MKIFFVSVLYAVALLYTVGFDVAPSNNCEPFIYTALYQVYFTPNSVKIYLFVGHIACKLVLEAEEMYMVLNMTHGKKGYLDHPSI